MIPKQHKDFSIKDLNIRDTINKDGFKESIALARVFDNFVGFEVEFGRIRKFDIMTDDDNKTEPSKKVATTLSRFATANLLLYIDTYSIFVPYIGAGVGFAGFELDFDDQ